MIMITTNTADEIIKTLTSNNKTFQKKFYVEIAIQYQSLFL